MKKHPIDATDNIIGSSNMTDNNFSSQPTKSNLIKENIRRKSQLPDINKKRTITLQDQEDDFENGPSIQSNREYSEKDQIYSS